MSSHPFAPFLDADGVCLLDGGLATELEARGADLNDPLWSAKVLLDDPQLVRDVHDDYLAAGADCIVSATYQASHPGFRHRGMSDADATRIMRSAVDLALDAREAYWTANPLGGRPRPLVAASMGPYGAYLADGSEYTGDYRVGVDVLRDFHRERWPVLAESGADLLACETIPSGIETTVLLDLLRDDRGLPAWISFSCGDARTLRDGTALAEVVRAADEVSRVVAIGANCVAPSLVPAIIAELRRHTTKPIVAYPNSGERYDAIGKRWSDDHHLADFGRACLAWRQAGARILGGCCRTGPADIGAMRAALR